MATSGTLGKLSIDVVAEVASLVSDMGKAQEASAKASKEVARQWKESIDSIKDAFQTILGVGISLEGFKEVTGELAEIASEALHTAEEFANLEQTLGVSAKTIQTVSYAAALAGGSFDVATTALTHLTKSAAEANAGNEQLLAYFNAIGISATQLATLIKNPDDLIKAVTQHLSQFADGANKTTIELALMGKGAGAAVPMINELGDAYDELSKQAQHFAGVSGDDLAAMADVQRELNKTGVEVKGLGLQFTAELLPAIEHANAALQKIAESQSTKDAVKGLASVIDYVAEHWDQFVLDVESGSLALAFTRAFGGSQVGIDAIDKIKLAFAGLERDAKIAWAHIADAAASALVSIQHFLAPVLEVFSNAALLQGQLSLSKGLAELGVQFKNTGAAASTAGKAIEDANRAFDKYRDGLKKTDDAGNATVTVMDTMVVHAGRVAGEIGKLPDVSKHASDGLRDFSKQETAMAEQLDALSTDLAGPYAQAWEKYSKSFDDVDAFLTTAKGLYESGKISLEEYNVDVAIGTQLEAELAQRYNDSTAALQRKNDLGNNWLNTIRAQIDGLQQLGPVQQATTEVDKLYNQALERGLDLYGRSVPAGEDYITVLKKQRAELINTGAGLLDYEDKLKSTQRVLQSWASTAQQDFTQAFSAINKAIVEGGSVMTGLVDVAKTVVEQILLEFEKLAIINPLLKGIFGPAAGNLATLGDSGGLIGQLLGGGGSSGVGGAGASGFGISDLLGKEVGGVELGTIFQTVGAVYAGYSAYKNAGGGISGAAAGAAYGIGAYTIGTVGTAVAGGVAAAGVSGGLAAGSAALGAIPVVGWIALAAMAVNMISGGKLFGTAWKPTGSSSQVFSVSEDGAAIENFFQESKQKALFGGKKLKDVSAPATQDQIDAAAAFTDSLNQLRESAADILGTGVADIVTGSFKEVFDKSGKVTSQLSTILGQTFSESAQDFQAREFAANLIAQINKALGTEEASQLATEYESNAQTFFDAAQELLAAEVDIKNGMGLLGDDTSLTDVFNEVDKLHLANETLVQTYARLQAETQSVKAIYDDLGLTISKVGSDFVEFSDDLIKAAGGIDNLSKLAGNYFNNFYSADERAAAKLRSDQSVATKLGAPIGQDPNESMAQFRANFEAVQDSLSPEDVIKWLQFAEALAAVNVDLGTTGDAAQTAAQQYEAFIQPFRDAANGVTDFETAFVSLGDTLQTNIDQANALARAQGLQGASAEDVAAIIQESAQKGAAALQGLEQRAAQETSQLYGQDYINGLFEKWKSGDIFALQQWLDAKDSQVSQVDTSRYTGANALATDAAQIAAATGQNISDVLKNLGVPLAGFADDLKLHGKDLDNYLANLTDQADANLHIADNTAAANDLLTEILDSIRNGGYTGEDIAKTTYGSHAAFPGGKPGAGTAAAGDPIADVVDAIKTGTATGQTADQATTMIRILQSIDQSLQALRAQAGTAPPTPQRNFRTNVFG